MLKYHPSAKESLKQDVLKSSSSLGDIVRGLICKEANPLTEAEVKAASEQEAAEAE